MQKQFSRTQLLLGRPAIETLAASRVAVFGVGGVGGYVLEVLARSGVGAVDVIDNDRVCVTNVNRQLLATLQTVGRRKVDVAQERVHAINPQCTVTKFPMFFLPDNAEEIDLPAYDYVVDCVDTVTAKLELIRRCHAQNVPLLCCLGAAYKLDATQFQVTDLAKTINDPLAKVLRKRLRKENIRHVKVVYSPELPLERIPQEDIACDFRQLCSEEDRLKCRQEQDVPPSNAWVPATEGLIAGGEVVKDLILRAGTMRIPSPTQDTNSSVSGSKRGV